jgi:hypothetical protein
MESASMSSAAASPASPFRLPGSEERKPMNDGYGWNSRDLFAIYVPDTSSLKMCRGFSLPESADPTWAAYVAGLVDGDGSIWIQKGRTTQLYPAVAIRLGWKGRDILAALHQRHGGMMAEEKRRPHPKHAEVFYWKAQGTAARHVLQMIYPFLRIKRAQAATALHLASIWATGAKDRYSLGRQLQALMWVLNRTGPEYALPAAEGWLYIPILSEGTQQPKFSTTWPRSGCLSNGTAYRLPPLVPLTGEIGCGLWATPSAADAVGTTGGGMDKSLRSDVRMWPTPASRDYRHPNAMSCSARGGGTKGEQLPNVIGGPLNPTFVEFLMGYPRDYTEV